MEEKQPLRKDRLDDRIFKLVVLGHYSVGKTSVVQRFCTDTFDIAEEPTIGAAFMTKSVVLGESCNSNRSLTTNNIPIDMGNNNSNESFINENNLSEKDSVATIFGNTSKKSVNVKSASNSKIRKIDEKNPSTLAPKKRVKFNIWDTAGQERYRSLIPMYYRGSHASLIIFDLSSRATLETAKTWLKSLSSEPFLKVLIGNKCDLKETRDVSWKEGSKLASDFGCLYFEVSAKTGEGVRNIFDEIGEMLWKRVETDVEKRGREIVGRYKRKNASKKGFCCGF